MVIERSPFLPLPEGMVIGQVEITPTQLTVEVISTQPCACCPGCGNLSDAVYVSISARFTMCHAVSVQVIVVVPMGKVALTLVC